MESSDKRACVPLRVRLRERIEREGAISFHDWMEAALYDEREGYYCRSDLKRWGREGDYRTSPERSPLFAATCARYFAACYEALDRPAQLTIWEAGAGSGAFALQVLETLARSDRRIFSATRYVLDERSAAARPLFREKLSPFESRIECRSLSEAVAPVENCVLFANELLDAFPVHRVILRGGRLRELYVSVNRGGEFITLEQDPSTPALSEYLSRLNVSLDEGQSAEINLQAVAWLKRAAQTIKRGYLLLVDYGAEAASLYHGGTRPRGSLRAFRGHAFVEDILSNPGEQDITSTVDWTTIKGVCLETGFEIVSFERQDRFLLEAGFLEVLARMTSEASSRAEALSLSTTAREMVLPGGMSESFQVLVARRRE
jgi:SAM-dependent MidA family methyltransferase